MVVSLLPFRSVLTIVVILAFFLAIIRAADGSANPGSTAGLVVVVTDGVDPVTGVCAGKRQYEDNGTIVHRHDFQGLLKDMTSLLNAVIKDNMNGSSSLILLEMKCDDGVNVIIEKIVDLMTSKHVTGVVTITRGHVAGRIVEVLQYWNVSLVELVSADVITRESSTPNHFIVPHYAYWQMKHVMLAARVFNWTSLAISDQGQSSRMFYPIKDLFTRLAFENDICVLSRHLRGDVPTVIFQSDSNVSSTLDRTNARTVLLVGNLDSTSEQFVNRSEQFILHLHPGNTDDQRLVKAINVTCNITSNSSSVYSTNQQSHESLCMSRSSLHMTTFGVNSYLESFITSVSFLLSTVDTFGDPFSCNGSNISLECLLSESSQILLDNTHNRSNVLQSSRKISEIDYLNYDSNNPQDDFKYIMDDGSDTLTVPMYTPSAVFNRSCGNFCDKCMKCFPSTLAETKLMTSGEGDAIIVAFFPIHLSTQQRFCGEPNPAGYWAALAFLETIKSYISTLNMFSIQAVVFDSCSSLAEVTSVLHSLETCKFYFKEEVSGVNISRSFAVPSIIGYVNGVNNFDLPHDSNSKFSLSLQDFGYSTGINSRQRFINNMLVALSKIGWTVINVIASDQEPYRTLSELLNASPLSNTFCFVNQVVIRSDTTLRRDDMNEAFTSIQQTSAYLLLTNLEDTNLVLQSMREHAQHMTTKVSLVLTPWNLAFDVNTVLPYVDVIIRFIPVVKNVPQTTLDSLSNTLQAPETPWSLEFTNASVSTFLSSPKLELVLQGTEELLSTLEMNYNTGINMRDVNLRPTALKVSARYADRNYEEEIAYIDTKLSESNTFKGPSFTECRGWCPVCRACPTKAAAQMTSLYLDGDILITGLFPLHQTGVTAFSCGSPQNDSHKLLEVQSFMFAIDTFKMRYPALLPGLRIGGLVLDSCSNSATALKVIGDFETCALNFGGSATQPAQDKFSSERTTETYSKAANPSTNVAYILGLGDDAVESLSATLETVQLRNSIFVTNVKSLSPEPASFQFIQAILQTLTSLGWDKIIIITGKPSEFQQEVNMLISEAYKINICIVATFHIESFLLPVSSNVEFYLGMPVVLFSSKEESEIVFDSLKDLKDSYFWIIPMYHESWNRFLSKQDYFPLGSILIDRKSKENELYDTFLQNLTADPDVVGSLSSWFQDLWRLRFSCYFPSANVEDVGKLQECPLTAPNSDVNITSSEVYDAILHVDAILHSLHAKYMDKCPNGSGICDQLADDMRNKSWSLGPSVTFDYQGERLDYTFDGQLETTLAVFTYQKDGFEQIGSYFKPTLSLNVTQIRFYTADGSELNTVPRAGCISACQCLVASPVNSTYFVETSPYFYTTTGEFIDDLWAIIALAIGGFGAVLSLIFAIYVMYKVSRKALGKRFVSLGLTLLFSVASLYLTVLLFVFTPSEAVCGLRYFLTGLTYTLCFAVILVKLMSLQSYKLIGLGGEVSKINQFLTTFFIVGVQIAIGVQWWLNNKPTLYSVHDSSHIQKYTCNFHRREFVAYHAYVMLLILICCIYAISVRHEKKNMGEAKLLLSCSSTCVAIWATWLPCLILLDRKWSDVIICAGILSSATAVLLIIFIPKIRMVSRLKYDLSQKANVRNGHSLDTDFLYERPYSLPGTLTSTFSSAKMNYPKAVSSFDADVNY